MDIKPQPHIFQRLQDRMPAFMAAVGSMDHLIQKAGPLDEKYIRLIQVGGSAAIGSEGALLSHARAALEAGATTAEIRHALLCLTNSIGIARVAMALCRFDDELK